VSNIHGEDSAEMQLYVSGKSIVEIQWSLIFIKSVYNILPLLKKIFLLIKKRWQLFDSMILLNFSFNTWIINDVNWHNLVF
jgi:hypothetical protein